MPAAHLVQYDIAWERPEANFATVRRLLDAAAVAPGDLILLPEMFATGFSFNTAVTNDADCSQIGFLSDLARRHRAVVMGGRTLLPPGEPKARNVMTVVAPDDAGAAPRCEFVKIHPFPTELDAFEGGREVVTFPWPAAGLTACPAICYDLRFPELFRLGLKRGAELFALGACWPRVRQHHWRALLIARAIENQAFVLGCNRVGTEPGVLGQAVEYAGGSIVVSPKGEVLGELGDAQGVLSVPIDAAAVRDWRRTFRAWRDLRLI